MTELVFIGAGGHAKVVYDIAISAGLEPKFYIDDVVHEFLGLTQITDAQLPLDACCVMSIGGVTPEKLKFRSDLLKRYNRYNFPTLVHNSAIVSANSVIGIGTTVGAGVVINSASRIGKNVIINTGAIVEHDVSIADGAHICPGAILLGGCKIGSNALIGAGAVILPKSEVPDNTLIKSNTRH